MFNGCGMTYYGLGLIRMARPVLQLDRADLIGDTLDKSGSLSETVYSAASHLPWAIYRENHITIKYLCIDELIRYIIIIIEEMCQ